MLPKFVVCKIETKFSPLSKEMITTGTIKFDDDIVFETCYDSGLLNGSNVHLSNFSDRIYEKAAYLLRDRI